MPFCFVVSLFALGCGTFLPLCIRPTFFHDLFGPADGEGIWGNIVRDAGGGAYICAFAYADWGDQSRVASDERSIFNHCFMFVYSVIVAGDGAGSNVYSFSDLAVSQVGQVVGLGAFPHFYFLRLDEIAYMRPFADLAARPEMRVGTYHCQARYAGAVQN